MASKFYSGDSHMSKSVKIQGLKEFMREVSRKGPALDQAIDKEINLSALRVEKCAKELALGIQVGYPIIFMRITLAFYKQK